MHLIRSFFFFAAPRNEPGGGRAGDDLTQSRLLHRPPTNILCYLHLASTPGLSWSWFLLSLHTLGLPAWLEELECPIYMLAVHLARWLAGQQRRCACGAQPLGCIVKV